MNRFRSWYQSRAGARRPMILAHRGDSFHAPENTMEAARLGLESAADGWELDVRLTVDGCPVVIHDESLRRTTDVSRRFAHDDRRWDGFPVGQYTLEEIQGLDAGSWFIDPNSDEPRSAIGFGTLEELDARRFEAFGSGNIHVPTLEEAIGWTVESDWLVNVEIKPTRLDREALVTAVLDVIERRNGWAHVTISSFDLEVVETIARREPRVATGALISGRLDEQAERGLRSLGIDAIHGTPWCSTSIEDGPLLVYTVNDVSEGGLATKLAAMGITGLFTDDPWGMMRLFGVSPS